MCSDPFKKSTIEDILSFDSKNAEDPDDMGWINPEGNSKVKVEHVDFGSGKDTRERNMVELLKRHHIRHISLWRYTTDEKGKTMDEYPLKWDAPCFHCKDMFPGCVPIFPPTEDGYDERLGCWILEPFAHCGGSCAKGRILESSDNGKERRLGLLGRFMREYFGVDTIHYIPLSVLKDLNPLGGYMTREEYAKESQRMDGMLKKPPFRFVDTSVELIDSEQLDKERKKYFEKLATAKVSEEQQNNFRITMERIVKERLKTTNDYTNSKIGKQLNLFSKSSK